jgi:radical SAM protein with 4Fe4S-binding SPASM domain
MMESASKRGLKGISKIDQKFSSDQKKGELSSVAPPARPFFPFIPRHFFQLVNLLKVTGGLVTSLLLRRPFVWGDPLIVHIEPTSLCNLKCPLCPSGTGLLTRHRSKLNFNEFKIILDKLPESLRMLLLWNQGEPFLVKELPQMIEYARKRDIYVSTSTNGHFLHHPASVRDLVKADLNELIISLDGADQKTYEKYRSGGNLTQVFEGIRNVCLTKKQLNKAHPIIHLQFILMRHNQHQMNQMIHIGKQLGVNRISFKTLQLGEFEGAEHFLPDNPHYTRYLDKDRNGNYVTRKRRIFPNDCLRLWYSMVINCDGRVSPCCFDKDGRYSFGNLFEDSFTSIWYGHKFWKFRQNLLKSRYYYDMCRDCSEGLKSLFVRSIRYN